MLKGLFKKLDDHTLFLTRSIQSIRIVNHLRSRDLRLTSIGTIASICTID